MSPRVVRWTPSISPKAFLSRWVFFFAACARYMCRETDLRSAIELICAYVLTCVYKCYASNVYVYTYMQRWTQLTVFYSGIKPIVCLLFCMLPICAHANLPFLCSTCHTANKICGLSSPLRVTFLLFLHCVCATFKKKKKERAKKSL
jgi:hypothetical protein